MNTANTAWIEKARRIDFDALDMKLSERLGVLRMYVQNIDRVTDDMASHEALCRDLIFPCIMTLAQFIESVNIAETPGGR